MSIVIEADRRVVEMARQTMQLFAPPPSKLADALAVRAEVTEIIADLQIDACDITSRLARLAWQLTDTPPTSLDGALADLAELGTELMHVEHRIGGLATDLASLVRIVRDAAFGASEAKDANLQWALENRLAACERLKHLYSGPGLTDAAERRALHDCRTAEALVRLAQQDD